MRFISYLLVFLTILVVALSGLVVYESGMLERREFKPFEFSSDYGDIYENISQFYPNMRYVYSEISYSISNDCSGEKREDIRKALEILAQLTVLRFYQTDDKAEIEYVCSKLAEEPERKNYYIAGEGGPKEIIESGIFNVILSGKVSLYREEKCDTPNVAIHETLHALGFDHNNNPESVMYPVTSCDEEIDDYIINEINYIYSTESLADLVITRISANREGRYISFDIDVVNQGLIRTSPIVLSVYADDELVRTFDQIEGLGIGYKKIITVQNLKIPYNSDSIKFSVKTIDDSNEIDFSNNNAIIRIEEK